MFQKNSAFTPSSDQKEFEEAIRKRAGEAKVNPVQDGRIAKVAGLLAAIEYAIEAVQGSEHTASDNSYLLDNLQSLAQEAKEIVDSVLFDG